jgi:putative SOS response-associated peptidase YedK
MCYAFSLRSDPSGDKGYTVVAFGGRDWKTSHNIRPGELHPIEKQAEPKQLTLALWTFAPHWMPDAKKGVINARGETLATKPYFRQAFKNMRCAIPSDGFFEFAKFGEERKPYFFHLPNNERFMFAGVFDELPDKDGLLGFAIITTVPNELVAKVHDRMPAMLTPAEADVWVAGETPADQLQSLLRPYPADAMRMVGVGKIANNPRAKGPEVIAPLA